MASWVSAVGKGCCLWVSFLVLGSKCNLIKLSWSHWCGLQEPLPCLLTLFCIFAPNMQSKGSLWHFKGAVSCSHPISKVTELKGNASAVNLAHSFQFLTTELKKSVIHIINLSIYRVWCFLQGASIPSTGWSPSWYSEGDSFVSIPLHLSNCL